MHASAHPLVPLAPDGLELDPGGGDVDCAERAEIKVPGAAAAVSHEVEFGKPRAGAVPLGEGAEGNLVPEPGAHVGGRGPVPRPRGARGGEQPAEGGGTDLPDEPVDLGRQPQLTVAREPIEELGHEGMEPLRPDAPGGLPEDRGRLGHRRPGDRRPPRGRSRPRRPRRADRTGCSFNISAELRTAAHIGDPGYVTCAPISMSHASRGGRARQLVIGIDAMEWQLVRRWASAGTLPTFRQLLERGAHAELSPTAAHLPDTVWASIYTGTNTAKFEKYFYVQYDPATMGLRMVPDDAITTPPFWKLLSDAGVRVGVADAPKFPVSALLNGFQITNWGAHATKTARASY